MNKFSKPRLDSRNAKQNYVHYVYSTLEKKSVCLAVRIVGVGVRIVVGVSHKNIFQLLTRSFYERKNEYHLSSQW